MVSRTRLHIHNRVKSAHEMLVTVGFLAAEGQCSEGTFRKSSTSYLLLRHVETYFANSGLLVK